MLKALSYLFYAISIIIAFFVSFQILNQLFPEYGIFHILVGFIGTAMFFPLIPLYPAINNGEWIYLLLCYISILFGVILSNKARKS
mgnify:FL=1|tara:strand:+ start:157 stop:414 length:258 start_codon:yes stop_codon:yes gene_type:complete